MFQPQYCIPRGNRWPHCLWYSRLAGGDRGLTAISSAFISTARFLFLSFPRWFFSSRVHERILWWMLCGMRCDEILISNILPIKHWHNTCRPSPKDYAPGVKIKYSIVASHNNIISFEDPYCIMYSFHRYLYNIFK